MYADTNILVTEDVRMALESATYIAASLHDDTIRTIHVIWAMLNEDSLLSEIIYDLYQIEFDFSDVWFSLSSLKDYLEKILGKDVVDNVYNSFLISVPLDNLEETLSKIKEEIKNEKKWYK